MARTRVQPEARQRRWLKALALSALPSVVDLLTTASPTFYASYSYGGLYPIAQPRCTGFELATSIREVFPLGTLLGHPVLVVAGAFALWEVTRRRSGAPTRAGRTAGWVALAFLVFRALYTPLLMALDLSDPDQCRSFWVPFLDGQVAWSLCWILPSVALYLALRGAAGDVGGSRRASSSASW